MNTSSNLRSKIALKQNQIKQKPNPNREENRIFIILCFQPEKRQTKNESEGNQPTLSQTAIRIKVSIDLVMPFSMYLLTQGTKRLFYVLVYVESHYFVSLLNAMRQSQNNRLTYLLRFGSLFSSFRQEDCLFLGRLLCDGVLGINSGSAPKLLLSRQMQKTERFPPPPRTTLSTTYPQNTGHPLRKMSVGRETSERDVPATWHQGPNRAAEGTATLNRSHSAAKPNARQASHWGRPSSSWEHRRPYAHGGWKPFETSQLPGGWKAPPEGGPYLSSILMPCSSTSRSQAKRLCSASWRNRESLCPHTSSSRVGPSASAMALPETQRERRRLAGTRGHPAGGRGGAAPASCLRAGCEDRPGLGAVPWAGARPEPGPRRTPPPEAERAHGA